MSQRSDDQKRFEQYQKDLANPAIKWNERAPTQPEPAEVEQPTEGPIFDDLNKWNTMGEVARHLRIKGLGRTKLFELLRQLEILGYRNEPKEEFVRKGFFKIKDKNIGIGIVNVPLVSQKGAKFIHQVIMENKDKLEILRKNKRKDLELLKLQRSRNIDCWADIWNEPL